MLYNTLKRLKARGGLTADLTYKIDIFFALGKLSESEYNDLLDKQIPHLLGYLGDKSRQATKSTQRDFR